MHRELKELFKNAVGSSEFVIAVNLDVRGFTAFCTRVDSINAAVFIKRVYLNIINDYFKSCSFFKPTGDGLLILVPYSHLGEDLEQKLNDTIEICFKLIKDFPDISKGDHMINFEVPKYLGIGLSRGSACRLASGEKILDYSGRTINLASRLMDIARPSGIIFDGSFGYDLLKNEYRDRFAQEKAYIKGVAEKEPLDIYVTKEFTTISPAYKKPLDEINWKEVPITITLGRIEALGPKFLYPLPSRPLDSNQISIILEYPCVGKNGKVEEGVKNTNNFLDFKYYVQAGKPQLLLDYASIANILRQGSVKDEWEATIRIIYPEE